MKPIRFYHWWAYYLYYWLWTPILKQRPDMVQAMIDYSEQWLAEHYNKIEKSKQ